MAGRSGTGRTTTQAAAGRGAGGSRSGASARGSGRGSAGRGSTARGRGTGSRSRSTSRRPPAKRQGPDLIDRSIDAVGRGVLRLGRSTGRAVGRTRDIDSAHRRDGLGFTFLVLAVITAAGVWFSAGGSVGYWFNFAVGSVLGVGGVLLPVILLGVGVVLVTTPAHPEARPRIVTGALLLALGVLGLVHLGSGAPTEPAGWAGAGGAIGYVAGTPLASGLTLWTAIPVLVLLSAYALLLLTGTPVREVPARFRRLMGDVPEEAAVDEPRTVADAVAEGETGKPARRRSSRRRQHSAEADAFGEDGEHQPAPDDPEVPATEAPAGRTSSDGS
ncbi:MAG: DNA translocase FtsK 4TM domain-containing protein, partial [Pseudonocardia sp.]|nr:DNA translocase FtsK 4TM domain-containing protein [Pseudonocardia sp.]